MPQSATANMGLIQPSEGSDDDVWDVLLTTLFNRIDIHDHSSGLGVKVPSSGLKINADVAWTFGGTNYAITDLKAIDFTPVAAASVSSLAGALFVSSADNELYFRTTSGSNVQITSGTSLNVAAFVGGIGGDYSSISALLDYDDATDMYRLRQELSGGVRQFAKMQVADIHLVEYDAAGDVSVPANVVRIKSPDALAASYDVVFPAAVPAAQKMVQVSTAGVLSFSNVIATDQNVELQGDGRLLHANYSRVQGALPTYTSGGGMSYGYSSNKVTYVLAGSAQALIPLHPLSEGERIKSFSIRGSSANNPTIVLVSNIGNVGATMACTDAGTTITGDNIITRTVDSPINTLQHHYYLDVTAGAGAFTIWEIEVFYDRVTV